MKALDGINEKVISNPVYPGSVSVHPDNYIYVGY